MHQKNHYTYDMIVGLAVFSPRVGSAPIRHLSIIILITYFSYLLSVIRAEYLRHFLGSKYRWNEVNDTRLFFQSSVA